MVLEISHIFAFIGEQFLEIIGVLVVLINDHSQVFVHNRTAIFQTNHFFFNSPPLIHFLPFFAIDVKGIFTLIIVQVSVLSVRLNIIIREVLL